MRMDSPPEQYEIRRHKTSPVKGKHGLSIYTYSILSILGSEKSGIFPYTIITAPENRDTGDKAITSPIGHSVEWRDCCASVGKARIIKLHGIVMQYGSLALQHITTSVLTEVCPVTSKFGGILAKSKNILKSSYSMFRTNTVLSLCSKVSYYILV